MIKGILIILALLAFAASYQIEDPDADNDDWNSNDEHMEDVPKDRPQKSRHRAPMNPQPRRSISRHRSLMQNAESGSREIGRGVGAALAPGQSRTPLPEKRGLASLMSTIGGDSAAAKKFVSAFMNRFGDTPGRIQKSEAAQNSAIRLILDLLVQNDILDSTAADQLVLTGSAKSRPDQVKPVEALTPETLAQLNIYGTARSRKRFLAAISSVLAAKSSPKAPSQKDVLVNALVDLLKENRILDEEVATRLVTVLGFQRIKDWKQDGNIFGITFGGNKQASDRFITAISVIFGGRKPDPGKASGNILHLINHLLELLVGNNILQARDAASLAATFGVRVTPKGSIDFPGRVLSTSDAKKVTIGGDKQARDAFLQSLLALLDVKYEQTGRDRAAFIANMVLRLSTDNEIIDQESGAQLIKLFSYQGGEKPSVFTVKLKGSPIAAATFISSVRNLLNGRPAEKDSLEDYGPKVASLLLNVLVGNSLLSRKAAARISGTFGLETSQQETELTPHDMLSLKIDGKPEARFKAVVILNVLIDTKYADIIDIENRVGALIAVLLSLAQDNDLLRTSDVALLTDMLGIRSESNAISAIESKIAKPPNPLTIKLGSKTEVNARFFFIVNELQNPELAAKAPFAIIDIILDLLVDYVIIDGDAAARLAATFGIRGDSPYTLDDISELHITGNQTAHSFFVHLIKRLIDTDTAPRGFNKVAFVIRSLVDLASANNIIDFLGASKLLENFGAGGDIRRLDPRVATALNVTLRGDLMPALRFVIDFEAVIETKGEENLRDNVKSVAFLFLQLLAGNKVFSEVDAQRIAVTFGLSQTQPTIHPFTKETITTLSIGGNQQSRDEILSVLAFVLNRRAGPTDKEGLASLVSVLLELSVENGIIYANGANKFARLLGTVEYNQGRTDAGERALAKLGIQKLGGLIVSRPVFYSQFEAVYSNKAASNPQETADLTGKLFFKTLIANSIFDQETASDLAATFGIAPIRREKNRQPAILQLDSLSSLNIGGNSNAKSNFMNWLKKLLSKNTSSKDKFLSVLLQLLVDNAILDLQNASKLASYLALQFPPQDVSVLTLNVTVTGSEAAGQSFLKQVKRFLDNAKTDRYTPVAIRATFSNLLLQLLANSRIFDRQTAADLAFSFGGLGIGQFEIVSPSTPVRLTASTISTLRVAGKPEARARFVGDLQKLAKTIEKFPDNSVHLEAFIRILLRLVVENSILDDRFAAKVASSFGVTYPQEVASKSSEEDTATYFSITVKGNDQARKKFVSSLSSYLANKNREGRSSTEKASSMTNLLLQFYVDNHLIPQELAVDLLGTFGIPTQGQSQLTGTPRLLTSTSITTAAINGNGGARLKLAASLIILYDQKILAIENADAAVLSNFAVALLHFGVDNDLFGPKAAEELATNFGISYVAAGPVKTPADIPIKLGGNATAAQKFLDGLVDSLATKPEHPDIVDSSATLIQLLLRFLVDNSILDDKTSANLVGTFSVTDNTDQDSTPAHAILTPAAIPQLQLGGSDPARAKFIQNLIVLLDKKSIFGSNTLANLYHFINILLQLTVDNVIVTAEHARRICFYFDVYYITVDFYLPSASTISSVKVGGSKDASKQFLESVSSFVPSGGIAGAQDISYTWSTFTKILIQLLVGNSLLDQKTAGDLVANFSPSTTEQAKPLTAFSISTIKVSGATQGRQKFLTALTVLLEKQLYGATDTTTTSPNFIKILLQLTVDNSIFDEKDAGRIGAYFSIYFVSVDVVTAVSSIPASGGDSEATKKFIDAITVFLDTPSSASVDPSDKLGAFTNLLLRLLVDNGILDVDTAGSLIATFTSSTTNEFSFDGAWEPIKDLDDVQVVVSGDIPARSSFFTSIAQLVAQQPSSDEQTTLSNLIKSLLRLVVVNEIFDVRFTTQIASRFGVTIETSFFIRNNTNGECCGGFSAALDTLMAYEASRRYLGVSSKDQLSNMLSKRLIAAGVIDNACTAI